MRMRLIIKQTCHHQCLFYKEMHDTNDHKQPNASLVLSRRLDSLKTVAEGGDGLK